MYNLLQDTLCGFWFMQYGTEAYFVLFSVGIMLLMT